MLEFIGYFLFFGLFGNHVVWSLLQSCGDVDGLENPTSSSNVIHDEDSSSIDDVSCVADFIPLERSYNATLVLLEEQTVEMELWRGRTSEAVHSLSSLRMEKTALERSLEGIRHRHDQDISKLTKASQKVEDRLATCNASLQLTNETNTANVEMGKDIQKMLDQCTIWLLGNQTSRTHTNDNTSFSTPSHSLSSDVCGCCEPIGQPSSDNITSINTGNITDGSQGKDTYNSTYLRHIDVAAVILQLNSEIDSRARHVSNVCSDVVIYVSLSCVYICIYSAWCDMFYGTCYVFILSIV